MGKGAGSGDGKGETKATKTIYELLEWQWKLSDTFMCCACCCYGWGLKAPDDGWCSASYKNSCCCSKCASSSNCFKPACILFRCSQNNYCLDCCYEDEPNPGQCPLPGLPKCFCCQQGCQQKNCINDFDYACAYGACGSKPGEWEFDLCRQQNNCCCFHYAFSFPCTTQFPMQLGICNIYCIGGEK